MSITLTLDTKPECPSPFATRWLRAAQRIGTPDIFYIESTRNEDLRDFHTNYLTRDQARQLRDEIDTFLGRDMPTVTRENNNLSKANLTLHAENNALRQRVASLEKTLGDTMQDRHHYRAENVRLTKQVASLEKDLHDELVIEDEVSHEWHAEVERLKAENARLKVDLMNERAQHADLAEHQNERVFQDLIGKRFLIKVLG